MKPNVCILRTDGTNCDEETAYAFEKAGGLSELVHVNQLRGGQRRLRNYQILTIPGGFSYGDDIRSGKILAVELASFLQEEIKEFTNSSKLVLGICNGFQVLVQSGLLPLNTLGVRYATLRDNESGKFECRWVNLIADKRSPCVFTKGYDGEFTLPVAHGEGNFFTHKLFLDTHHTSAALLYSANGYPTADYPENPNGSVHAIAGICDPSGRIFGLMPHPERFVELEQYDNWRRGLINRPHGLLMFENAVRFFG